MPNNNNDKNTYSYKNMHCVHHINIHVMYEVQKGRV